MMDNYSKVTTIPLLNGKKGVILGVANQMSIAWAIAHTCHAQGAQIALTYQDERLRSRVEPLAKSTDCSILVPCNVHDTDSMDQLFSTLKDQLGQIDFLVHSIAYADKEELKGRYVDTSQNNFLHSLNISCYSFTYLSKKAAEIMPNGGSILTLSYYGARRVMPAYNVMGVAKAALETSVRYIAADLGPLNIRVNAISAGPIRTLASSGINNFKSMLDLNQSVSPLRRNTTQQDVANTAIYLLSDLSSGMTGQINYVDCGYSILGVTTNANKS